MNNSEYSNPIVKITSANTISEQRREEKREQAISNFLITSGTIIGAAYAGNVLLKNDKISNFFNSSIMKATIEETAPGRTWDSMFSDGANKSKFTLLEGVRKLEELSPFRVMRTLQLSHVMMPFITGKDTATDISANLVRSQEAYFRPLLKNRGEVDLTSDHLRYGFRLEDGKLFAKTKSGAKGDMVMKVARLSMSHMALPKDNDHHELVYVNKILKQYSTIIGAGKTDSFNKLIGSNTAPFLVVGAESESKLAFDLFRSYSRNLMAQGSKVLNRPISQIEELIPNIGDKKWFQYTKDIIRPGLGSTESRQSIGKSLASIAWNQRKLIGGLSTYYAVDNFLESVSSEGDKFEHGLFAGLATIAVNTQLAFAEMWSDNFQGYKEAQEYYAPDSTSLFTMAGTPLALGTAAATGSYAKRLYDNAVHGIDVSEKEAEKITTLLPKFIGKHLPDKIANLQGTRFKKWGVRGALIGLALEAPFIPGALIGESSEKLRKEYTGEEDVAIRANRWWFTGCLVPDHKVITSNELKNARDVIVGDKLVDRNGIYNRVEAVLPRHVEENVYNIKLWNSSAIDSSFTGNHPLLCMDSNNVEIFKRADDVGSGDWVVSHIPKLSDIDSIDILDYVEDVIYDNDYVYNTQKSKSGSTVRSSGKCRRHIEVDNNLGRLLGWFLAEGTLPKDITKRPLIEFACHRSEENFAIDIGDYIHDKFELNYTIYRQKTINDLSSRLRISSRILWKLIYGIMYIDNKKICPNLSHFNKDFLKGFIQGFFYGDGTISKVSGIRKRASIKAKNIQHLIEVRRFLPIFGIYPYIIKDQDVYKIDFGIYGSAIAVRDIGIYKELYSFDGDIQNIKSNSQKKYKILNGKLLIKIKEVIIYEYKGLVYDYTVEDSHEFSNSLFIVHNSGRYGGDHIKYFDKSAYAKMMADTNDVSLYGDVNTSEVKKSLNPILHPFDYLRDPYKFEKLTSEDRPYPVWGMDISTATFIGKLYEKTLGAIIKPDVINPELAPFLSDLEPGSVVTGESTVTPKGIERALSSDTFSLKTKVSKGDASLIAEGKLIAPAAATYDPNTEAASWSWEAFKDFIGLKGWLLGEAEDALGAPTTQVPPQLARSGEITNAANAIRDANLGGLFSLTESQRRYIPTSAAVTKDRVNPLKNSMPSWLPGEDDDFWLDLQQGDPFLKVEHGASRLPGRGYATLNPILKDINPEDYPDIFKFKILSDVAMGSESYYDVKNRVEKREGSGGLTNYEQGMYQDIKKKEFLRSQKREFREYKTESEMESASTLQKIATSYWETGTHNIEGALPSEFLTFFRPAGKLIHQRTAIEDYERTQLEGSDMAVWTKPIDHFLKPAAVSARRMVEGDYISEDVREKRDIDQYFDTLEYVKQRKLYEEAMDEGDSESASIAKTAFQKTTEGAIASGLDTDQEILRSYISMPKAEKAYFSSFINANQEDRAKIKSISPDRVGALYETIWERKDIMDKAIASGATAEQANAEVQSRVRQEDQRLRDDFSEEYEAWLGSKSAERSSFREHLADKRASEYVKATGGMPDEDFSGWDPRIDMDKIKLRSLTIGGEDFFKYGFWKDDKIDLERYTSVISDKNPKEIIDNIKESIREEVRVRDEVTESLHREGYIVNRVDIERNGNGIDLRVEQI